MCVIISPVDSLISPFLCISTFSTVDNKLADVCRQGVEDEEEEEPQDNQNDQSNDVLLVLLPDKEHKGLHRIHKPVEGCLRAT